MENCLVTKLKGTVNNDSLKKLGELELIASGVSSSANGWITVFNNIGGHVNVVGGIAYTDDNRSTALGSEFDIASNLFRFTLSDGDSVIKITSVYGITRISFGANLVLRIDDLAYAKEGVSIGFYDDNPLVGNIDSISNRNTGSIILNKMSIASNLNLEGVNGSVGNIDKFAIDYGSTSSVFVINFKNSGIVGDVSAFGEFNSNLKTKITTISTNTTNVGKLYGNVESFEDYVNMRVFDLNYIALTGNLATALGSMIQLELIAVGGHSAAEDLKNLFDALYDNGKTSGSIHVWAGSNKTVNGTPWVNGNTVTFSASGWTVNS